MKHFFSLALPLVLVGSTPAFEGVAAARGEARKSKASLRVRIRGLDNDRGRVAVALFDAKPKSKQAFPDQERARSGQLAAIADGAAEVTFAGLEPGVYAVAVLHDENSNSKMDFNFLGMPLEGYGFSNDASATFGPPSFAEAAFRLRARRSVIAVKMRYLLR